MSLPLITVDTPVNRYAAVKAALDRAFIDASECYAMASRKNGVILIRFSYGDLFLHPKDTLYIKGTSVLISKG